jgi:hypothetical protein
LVVFDIDFTLIETVQEFGSYVWSINITKRLQEKGYSYADAIKKLVVATEQCIVSEIIEKNNLLC